MAKIGNRNSQRTSTRTWKRAKLAAFGALACSTLAAAAQLWAQTQATDPGVRGVAWCIGCPNGAGAFQSGLTTNEQESEAAVTAQFQNAAVVTCSPDGSNVTACGLGPRFNSNSCTSCHQQPVLGGSSPVSNPLFQVYQSDGTDTFNNMMPEFEKSSGPVLIPRLPVSSGGTGFVQQIFTISGSSYPSCNIQQPNFSGETGLVFRQPLPTFGDGYIDFVENKDILNNLNSNLTLKASLGIGGVANIADDGSVSRLGWKAQWRAILPAVGAEEQIEEGITNEMFATEIDQTASCDLNPVPEDPTNYAWYSTSPTPWLFLADAERDAIFVRFLATPVPSTASPTQGGVGPGPGCPDQAQGGQSCIDGLADFNSIGCVLCHTTSYRTPPGSIPSQGHTLLTLYSDLLLHHMGNCLADNITQGLAQGDMWRTPPLWNVGQRIWFMHDGRTKSIVTAVEDHADPTVPCIGTYPASEADAVVKAFNGLASTPGVDGTAQQDLINFLRTL
jgi:CxxC motif-containing protein (DUF1111 family)